MDRSTRGYRCPVCDQRFATVGMFDEHRVGHVNARRCLRPADLGWQPDSGGVWHQPPAFKGASS